MAKKKEYKSNKDQRLMCQRGKRLMKTLKKSVWFEAAKSVEGKEKP